MYVRLATASQGQTLVAVDAGSKSQVLLLPLDDPREPAVIRDDVRIRDADLSPDGQWLVTSALGGHGPRLWNAGTGVRVTDLLRDSGNANVAFSPDGRWLAASTSRDYHLWHAGSWQPHVRIDRKQRGNLPGPLAFSRDGNVLAVATTDRHVQLIDAETGVEIATLQPPTEHNLTWLCFSPDGTRLACSTEDHIIQVWDLDELKNELAKIGLNWF
jgi:WD40 repeat protein